MKNGNLVIGKPQLGRTSGFALAQAITNLKPGESITTYVRSRETGNRAVHSIIFRQAACSKRARNGRGGAIRPPNPSQ